MKIYLVEQHDEMESGSITKEAFFDKLSAFEWTLKLYRELIEMGEGDIDEEEIIRERYRVLGDNSEEIEFLDPGSDVGIRYTLTTYCVNQKVWLVEERGEFQHIFHSKESAVEFIIGNVRGIYDDIEKEKERVLKIKDKTFNCFDCYVVSKKSVH